MMKDNAPRLTLIVRVFMKINVLNAILDMNWKETNVF